jgi:hypothetical protein
MTPTVDGTLTHLAYVTENTEAFCGSPRDDPATELFTSYASHNPTLLRRLALVTSHSAGLQAVDISNPSQPKQAGWYSPTPLAAVATEDPALLRGPNKVVMWIDFLEGNSTLGGALRLEKSALP